MKCIFIPSHLQFYPRLTSPFSIGDFYRGCGVRLLVFLLMFPCSTAPIFYSISMVDITQEKPTTVMMSCAKQATCISTSPHLTVDVQRSVDDFIVIFAFSYNNTLGGYGGKKNSKYVPGPISPMRTHDTIKNLLLFLIYLVSKVLGVYTDSSSCNCFGLMLS